MLVVLSLQLLGAFSCLFNSIIAFAQISSCCERLYLIVIYCT